MAHDKVALKALAIELAAAIPPLPPPTKTDLIDRIDEINPKLSQAAAIVDLIRASYFNDVELNATSIPEAANAAQQLIQEARNMVGKIHEPVQP